MKWLLPLLAVAAAACKLDASYDGTTFKCDMGQACPDGTTCTAGYCLPPSDTTPDAPVDGGTNFGSGCATSVIAGDNHTCMVRDDKTVWCWGANDHGQLGDGTTVDRTAPTQVAGLANIAQLARGGAFTCALAAGTGTISCWGYDGDGNLGDAMTSDEHTPVAVQGITGATQVAGGDRHACAIVGTDGAVWCWGANGNGQLGNGTRDGHAPAAIAGLTGVTSLTAYENTTCVVKADKTVACWGANNNGILGTNALSDTVTPVTIGGATGAATVALGEDFACLTTTTGAVGCWGYNGVGALGDGTGVDSLAPVTAAVPGTVTALAVANHHACAITSLEPGSSSNTVTGDGKRLWCWGDGDNGELGNGIIDHWQYLPVLAGVDRAVAITAGQSHTCAVDDSGAVACFGANPRGQLGDGARTAQPTPIAEPALAHLTKVSATGAHACALDAQGHVVCWGENDNGQLGDGTRTRRTAPVAVVGLPATIAAVAAGYDHTLALAANGDVYAWGLNNNGQVGPGVDAIVPIPQKVALPAGGAKQIVAGGAFSCALLTNGGGKVMCWGDNGYGELGDGDNTSSDTPVATTITGATQITAGQLHACAVIAGEKVACWGQNGVGQLGDGTTDDQNAPVTALVGNIAYADAGDGYTCVLQNGADAGKIACWGYNGDGELGLGRITYADTGTVANLTGATALWTGDGAACARAAGGAVSCWGAGYVAQAGLAFSNTSTPTLVAALPTSGEIALSESSGCAWGPDGSALCWGDDREGQLADGAFDHLDPVGASLTCAAH